VEELVKLVTQKTGISAEQASMAVKTVMGFLKERLPAPLGSQLGTLLENPAAISQVEKLLDNPSGLEDLTKGLGGLFGNK
jgi:hypothetical protein